MAINCQIGACVPVALIKKIPKIFFNILAGSALVAVPINASALGFQG